MKRPVLIDAQEMARLHPATFEAPTGDELAALTFGDNVKVCPASSAPNGRTERFWVQLTATSDSGLVGRIDNDLVFTASHGLRYNDVIEFERRHVYQILPEVPPPRKAMQ